MPEPETPSSPPVAPQTPQPAQPTTAKKGMGAIGWIAVGCVVLLVLAAGSCFVVGMLAKKKMGQVAHKFQENPAMASAEMVVRMNPDLELVDKDEDAGTMTIREKKTGKTMTLDVADIKQGKIHFSTDDGQDVQMQLNEDGLQMKQSGGSGKESTTVVSGAASKLPDWLPAYPGGSVLGGMSSSGPDGANGWANLSTEDSIDDVLAYYKSALEAAGFEVTRRDMTIGGSVSATLSATDEATGRAAQLTANRAANQEQTALVINYSQKN